ncbi:hypothetical protein [Streptomyces sp. NBC_00029]|uniref:hypothetical protein n=1 Tax=Streptomyces sp. NBC_00029 TaxID=2903613 RepID=UPI00386858BD
MSGERGRPGRAWWVITQRSPQRRSHPLAPRSPSGPGGLGRLLEEANECVAPRLGLPELPVVAWPEPSDEDGRGGLHWKSPALLDHAAGRPFIWVDDEITGADRAWVAARHPDRALLHRVDPGRGLTGADLGALRAWLRPD